MNSENSSKYVGFGLILGAAIGTLIGIFTSQIAIFVAIGAGLGLTAGAVISLVKND